MTDELPAEDQALLAAIRDATDAADPVIAADLIAAYWHDDMARAERAPRLLFYLHLGMMWGLLHRLRDDMRKGGWS